MPALLCTLGTSWAVVPEAFLLGNGPDRYERVFVLTTSSDDALHLADSAPLLRSVADRRIGIEMCPYANLQIVGFKMTTSVGDESRRADYPLKRYLDAGVPVTVNTDNIGISAASLSENFLLLPRLCPGITRLDCMRLVRHSIDQAFLPAIMKTELLGHPLPRCN